jgi:hypothetical protein
MAWSFITQRLDYMGIPFRCSWCRGTGHLRRDFIGKVPEEKLEDTLLQEDPHPNMLLKRTPLIANLFTMDPSQVHRPKRRLTYR